MSDLRPLLPRKIPQSIFAPIDAPPTLDPTMRMQGPSLPDLGGALGRIGTPPLAPMLRGGSTVEPTMTTAARPRLASSNLLGTITAPTMPSTLTASPDQNKKTGILGPASMSPITLDSGPELNGLISPVDSPNAPLFAREPNAIPQPLSPLLQRQADDYAELNRRSHHAAPTTLLGKIGHVAAGIGNALGDIFAPSTMALIPGTQLNNELQKGRLRADIDQVSQLQNEESQRAQGAALQRHLNDESEGLEHPRPEYQPLQTSGGYVNYDKTSGHMTPVEGPNGTPVMPYEKPGPMQHVIVAGPDGKAVFANYQNGKYLDPQGKEIPNARPYEKPPAATPEQQYIDEYQKMHPGSTIAQAERAYKTDTQTPQQPPQTLLAVPDGKGGTKIIVARPGQSIPAGAMTPTQLGAQGGLTSSTRTMIESAPGVISLVDRVSQLVDQQKKTLGPAASRWNEFMAGNVGAPNPEFTKLRTDVGLLTTKLMRMHVGARGGTDIMKHFTDLIDSSKQDPENLKAALGEIRDYAAEVQSEAKNAQGNGGGNAGGAPPAGAHVRDYTQLGGKK